MRKKKNIIILFLACILLLSLYDVKAYAVNCQIDITKDLDKIQAGSTVNLTFSTKNINVSDVGGMAGLSGTITYDKNLFEDDVKFTVQNKWVKEGFNSKSGKFILTKIPASNESESIFILTLKVKNNVTSDDKRSKIYISKSRIR